MPVVEDLDRPAYRTLVDANGVALARFLYVERDGHLVADLFELEAPVERAVPAVLDELRGWRVAGSETLGRALVAAGARPARHAHVYTHDLRQLPKASSTFELTPVDRPARDLLPAYLAAFAPGHPDRMEPADALKHLNAIVAGKLGPLLESSGIALRNGRVVGGILVARMTEGPPPFAGPWVMEVFREPGAHGAGRALLERALALSTGSLGLAVTHGNPAEKLYAALGFKRVFTAYSVDL